MNIRIKQQQQLAFNLAEPERKQCFKTDKFPTETFCLISEYLLSCFPVTSATDSHPKEEQNKKETGKKENPGDSMCGAGSVKSRLHLVLGRQFGSCGQGAGDSDSHSGSGSKSPCSFWRNKPVLLEYSGIKGELVALKFRTFE